MHLKPAAFRCWTMFYFDWKYFSRCFRIPFFSHYSHQEKIQMSLFGFDLGWRYSNVKIHGGIKKKKKKKSTSLSFYRRPVARGHDWEVCLGAAVQQREAVPQGTQKGREGEKQDPWKHLRAIKKWGETLKDRARGEKVSDDGIKVVPVLNVQCYSLTAFSAGYSSD